MLSFLLLLSMLGQSPPAPVPVIPDTAIHIWPEAKAPTPVPISPDAPIVVKPQAPVVFESQTELFYRAIPEGVVTVKKLTGPKTYFYTDETGEVKEKDFAGKFLLIVSPNPKLSVTASCQFLTIPKGVVNDKAIVTRIVEAQIGSKPPPNTNIIVPNVIGSKQSEATTALQAIGLGYTVTTEAAAVSQGVVLRQSPNAGIEVTKGATVALVVSGAPSPPPPDVPPAGTKFYFLMVEDVDVTPSIKQGRVAGAIDYWQSLAAQGHKWKRIDAKEPVLSQKNLTPFIAKAGGPPCLIVTDLNGKVWKSIPIPESTEAVTQILKGLGG